MDKVIIDGDEYISYRDIKSIFKITSDRVKKWRDGKGVGREIELRTIRLNEKLYLYNYKDIMALYLRTKK